MTHQFKFGDRVQDTEGRQFIFLRGHLSCCTVASSDGGTHVYLLIKSTRAQPNRTPTPRAWTGWLTLKIPSAKLCCRVGTPANMTACAMR